VAIDRFCRHIWTYKRQKTVTVKDIRTSVEQISLKVGKITNLVTDQAKIFKSKNWQIKSQVNILWEDYCCLSPQKRRVSRENLSNTLYS
jgi:hypothetical protein